MSEITSVYLTYKKKVDEWAQTASHPLLRAIAKIVQEAALEELQAGGEEDG